MKARKQKYEQRLARMIDDRLVDSEYGSQFRIPRLQQTRNRGRTAPQLTGIAETECASMTGQRASSRALRNEVNASLAGRIQSFTDEWMIDENVQENT
jgi:hypothetical protein